MSSVGMPSVMQTMSGMPASAASRMASAAKGGGHEDERAVGAGLAHGVGDGVEDGHAVLGLLAAAAGRDAGDDLRAVLDAALGLEAALLAGDALDEDAGVRVDEDAHCWSPGRLASVGWTLVAPSGY